MFVYDLVTADTKDETIAHTFRTVNLVKGFGEYLGVSTKDLHSLTLGALYHDRGKLKIPSRVLYKKGKLTRKEYELVKEHVIRHGLTIEDKDVEAIIMQHHEREDGSGYPYGLKGKDIHPLAKIFAIVDVYDALTCVRSYKRALQREEAFRIIRGMALHQGLVQHFYGFVSKLESENFIG